LALGSGKNSIARTRSTSIGISLARGTRNITSNTGGAIIIKAYEKDNYIFFFF
jgi:hypothetical protein